MPDAPRDRPALSRLLPDLRNGARTANDLSGGRAESRAGGHEAAAPSRCRSDGTAACPRNGRDGGARSHRRHLAGAEPDHSARPLDAGRALGWLAVLPARMGVGEDAQPEHVHADRARHRRGVRIQRGKGARLSNSLSKQSFPDLFGTFPDARCLLRGCRRHHDPRPPRPGPRAPCPKSYGGGDPGASRSRAEYSPARERGRRRRGRADRAPEAWRPGARAAG